MTEYDISKILDEMELEIVEALKGHLSEGLKGTTSEWQKRQLVELRRFHKENKKIIDKYMVAVNEGSRTMLKEAYKKSFATRVKDISKRARHGSRIEAKINNITTLDNLISIDDARIVAILDAVNNDIDNKMYSLYRRNENVYRQTIFKATTLVNTGQYDLVSAINLAQADYLAKGITDCLYKNGVQMPIRSYAEMALRTNAMRAASQARGMLMDYLEIHTVMISNHQSSCPLCGPWQSKVVLDDVYCTVDKSETQSSIYPLLSQAIAAGYKHPNCRHSEDAYDADIDDEYPQKKYTEEDKKRYEAEQKQREIEREIRKLKRQNAGTVRMSDELKAKNEQLIKHLEDNPLLKRKKWREEY